MTDHTGKHLYKYYQKKIHDALITLHEIKSIHSADEIHDLRVSIKKIRALFLLCEMLAPQKIDSDDSYKVFSKIFKQAGKIREMHINQALADKYNLPESENSAYKGFVSKEEKKDKKKFKDIIDQFDIKKFHKIDGDIKKICKKTNKDELFKHSKKIIHKKIIKIKTNEKRSDEDLHDIRKHLKAIATLISILCSVTPSKKLDQKLNNIENVEKSIGDMHDHSGFKKSIKSFLKDHKKNSGEFTNTKKLLTQLTKKNNAAVKASRNKVNQLFDLN